MNKIRFYFLLLLSTALFGQKIPDAPSPMRFVNDFADILDPASEQMLESRLYAYNDSTSTQVVIVTVGSLEGYEVEQVGYKIASTWGIGQKGKNNGLLILVAPAEHKMRVEVGYGLEGTVTDIRSKYIITDLMKPRFKEGNYAAGLDDATKAIIEMLSGSFKRDGTETDKKTGSSGGSFWTVLLILVGLVFVFMVFSRGNNKGGNGTTFYSGGAFYGGGGSSYDSGGGSSFDFGGGGFGGGGSSGDW